MPALFPLPRIDGRRGSADIDWGRYSEAIHTLGSGNRTTGTVPTEPVYGAKRGSRHASVSG